MAFMGRGGFSSGSSGNAGDGDNNEGIRRTHYRWYRRIHYYVPLDNTYVVMQMVATFIILIIGVLTFLATYKSPIIDPIESTKNLFITGYLIIITVFLLIAFIIHFISKNENSLIKRLAIILLLSVITMLAFWGAKVDMDKKYTTKTFEQFYTAQNASDDSMKARIDIGLAGMSLKSEKEYYISECTKLYGIFSTKFYGSLGMHAVLNVLLICQIASISKIQKKKDRLSKDDLIVYDEEQNIKI